MRLANLQKHRKQSAPCAMVEIGSDLKFDD